MRGSDGVSMSACVVYICLLNFRKGEIVRQDVYTDHKHMHTHTCARSHAHGAAHVYCVQIHFHRAVAVTSNACKFVCFVICASASARSSTAAARTRMLVCN